MARRRNITNTLPDIIKKPKNTTRQAITKRRRTTRIRLAVTIYTRHITPKKRLSTTRRSTVRNNRGSAFKAVGATSTALLYVAQCLTSCGNTRSKWAVGTAACTIAVALWPIKSALSAAPAIFERIVDREIVITIEPVRSSFDAIRSAKECSHFLERTAPSHQRTEATEVKFIRQSLHDVSRWRGQNAGAIKTESERVRAIAHGGTGLRYR